MEQLKVTPRQRLLRHTSTSVISPTPEPKGMTSKKRRDSVRALENQLEYLLYLNDLTIKLTDAPSAYIREGLRADHSRTCRRAPLCVRSVINSYINTNRYLFIEACEPNVRPNARLTIKYGCYSRCRPPISGDLASWRLTQSKIQSIGAAIPLLRVQLSQRDRRNSFSLAWGLGEGRRTRLFAFDTNHRPDRKDLIVILRPSRQVSGWHAFWLQRAPSRLAEFL